MYRYICPDCGAHLDPGERCDCIFEKKITDQKRQRQESELRKHLITERNGQLRISV